MTTYLGKSCSFCLPRVPFVNCRQFMYLVISLLVLRAGYGIWLYQFLIIAYLFTFHPIPTETDQMTRGRTDAGQKRLVLLGQIDLPSGDKAETTRRKWLMARRWHQVVLITRDFGPWHGAPYVSASRRFSTKYLNTLDVSVPRLFDTKIFRPKMDGLVSGRVGECVGACVRACVRGWVGWWVDGWTYFNYMYYVRMFRFI